MNKQRIVKHAPILREKLDAARRTVTCMLIAADTPDLHGDIMRPAAVTAALDSYMDTSQVVGRMHSAPTASSPRRVWQDSAGNAWTETHVADEADWQAIASGAYTGLSWAGFAYRSALPGGQFLLTEPEMLEYSFVDKPAVPEAVFKSEDDAGAAESLAVQIANGKVARRVSSPGAQVYRPASETPEAALKSRAPGIQDEQPSAVRGPLSASVDPPPNGGTDNAQESGQFLPEAGANDETGASLAVATLDAGPWTLDDSPLATLLAQLKESITQAFDLLLQRNTELAKRATAAGLQPGPSQRIYGDGADMTLPAEERAPAWLR